MEQLAYADSWNIEAIEKFMELPGLATEIADQCMYVLTTPSEVDGTPTLARKPTKFLSNSWCLLQELSTRCDKSHEHQHLVGGRGKKAAEYPDKLCRAICRGLANQKRYDASGKVCTGGMSASALQSLIASVNESDESASCKHIPSGNMITPWSKPCKNNHFPTHWQHTKHEPDGTCPGHIVTEDVFGESQLGPFSTGINVGAQVLRAEMDSLIERSGGYVEAWDDVSGAPLDVRLLREARAVEMEFFSRMGVWAEKLPKRIVKSLT